MVLGWHVSVFRQVGGGGDPAGADAWAKGARVAVWQTRLGGLSWIEGLVTQDRAIDLGGNGYPNRSTARARDLLPPIETGPPEANRHWRVDAGDVLTEGWEGSTVVDRAVARACRPDEWLMAEVWDES